MSTPSILILGLGELGKAVLDGITAHPHKGNTRVAVLTRTASKDHHLAERNVENLTGDVVNDSEEKLIALFRPFHTVVSCNGMTLPPETQVKLTRIALQSGIKRYFPWQFGVDYDVIGPNSSQHLFTTQLEVRAMLRSQAQMKWVIVSTGMFTSFLFEPSLGIVNKERTTVTAIGSWDNSITVTSPEDIGTLTAELALSCPEVEGVVYTAGDTVSMQRLADVVEQMTLNQIKRELRTVSQLKGELAADPENGMLKYRVVFGEGVGVAWDQSATFNARRGMKLESVDDWARANLCS